jgi:predicted TIM-barrel fold metal-dependent hydrolase
LANLEKPLLVDAHAHIFPEVRGMVGGGPTRSIGYGRAVVGEEEVQILPPYNERTAFTPKMILANMDWAGVDRVMLLQGPFYGECNQFVLEALQRYPERLMGAVYFDPWAQNSRNIFETLTVRLPFCALKMECSEKTGLCGIHPEARLDAAEIEWVWQELEKLGLVLVLDLGAVASRSYQTGAVRGIAERYPDLRIVVAHLGQPEPHIEANPDLWRLWFDQLDLGRLPNVFFDTSALPAKVPEESFPFPSAARYLRLALDRIGPSKIMWGTDQPGLLGVLNYPQLVQLAFLHTEFLSERERGMVLGENAMKVYGGVSL